MNSAKRDSSNSAKRILTKHCCSPNSAIALNVNSKMMNELFLLVYSHDNVETYGGRRVALFGSVTLVAQVLKMVCSKCQKWRDGEWLVWRRCDSWEHGWVPSCMHSFHFWQGLLWFFYCQRCRDTDPTLGSKYINADGNWSTDSESEVGELKEFEEPKPELPAGWARQRR